MCCSELLTEPVSDVNGVYGDGGGFFPRVRRSFGEYWTIHFPPALIIILFSSGD